jgi:P-type Ca2+ transporter type 2C
MNSGLGEARLQGLTEQEAASRLASDGPNVLPTQEERGLFQLLFGVAREPMVLLLLASGVLYFVLGDPHEALTLLASVVLVIAITVFQEGRTERALSALRDLSSPRAQVLRDGQARTVPARDLVRGDIIRIAEGDRVPADALHRTGTVLTVDESLLSGESAPVTKKPSADAALEPPGSESASSLFSGTLVTSGRGVAEVAATGPRSELGRIGTSLKSLEVARTPLQREVDTLVRRVAVIALGLAALVGLARGLSGHRWLDAILSGLTVAIALVPEEFPVVLTVFLALGAWRISKNRVLTRRVAVLETLGAVDILCTDKTGTLTQNRMSIRRLCTSVVTFTVDESSSSLPEDVHSLVEFGVLACPRDPFDPMEKAFLEIGRRTLTGTEHLHPKWTPVREYPLTPALLAVTHVWRSPERESLVVATKGAPEAVFDLCHLSPAESEKWRERATKMAKDGLRVLGVARSRVPLDASPERAHDIEFDMVGLVGLEDPLRPEIVDAVSLCKRAHIRVVMITGDHPETARAIARAAGIDAGGVLLGADIDRMDDDELAVALTRASVIARAVPAHKLRIVRSLRAQGLVIGMTGDGVNDAPALKAADVGIAMGARGTEVAREAASLVLVNDDFGSIVDAVRSGRRIYDNLRKAFGYIVAVHIPIAGVSVVPALLGWASVVLPVHVVFLELIIDPACSIVFEMEPEESNSMDNPPRSHAGHLLAARQTLWSALLGTASLCGTLWSLAALRDAGRAVEVQRALAFVSLVAGNLSILVAARSFTHPSWASVRKWNPALPVLCLGAIAVLIVVVGLPPLRAFFGFELGTPRDLFRAVLASAAPVFAVDSLKPLTRAGDP